MKSNTSSQWPTLPFDVEKTSAQLAHEIRRISWRSDGDQVGDDVAAEVSTALHEQWGMRDPLLTRSGSSALIVALRTLGVNAGDLVALPAGVWKGLGDAVAHVGASVAYYEIHQKGTVELLAANPADIRYVIAVHNHCELADIPRLATFFRAAKLIEDAAHCPGARHMLYPGWSHLISATIVSFEATKPVTCFEGGAVSFEEEGSRLVALELVAADPHTNNHHPESARPILSQLTCSLLKIQLSLYREVCERRRLGFECFSRSLKNHFEILHHPGVIQTGSFYGIPVKLVGIEPKQMISFIERETGLVCDQQYAPYRNWEREAKTRFPGAKESFENWIIIPHHAFLAPEAQIRLLAEQFLRYHRA